MIIIIIIDGTHGNQGIKSNDDDQICTLVQEQWLEQDVLDEAQCLRTIINIIIIIISIHILLTKKGE